jgi:hypothetical protein
VEAKAAFERSGNRHRPRPMRSGAPTPPMARTGTNVPA